MSDVKFTPPGSERGVLIPLTNGGHAIVDEEDVCRVDERKWFRHPVHNSDLEYAASYIREPGKRRRLILMHRVLFGLGPEDRRIHVDHKNHNGLDNRRSCNLRIATARQNVHNTRGRRKATSQYKGAAFDRLHNRWSAKIGTSIGGVPRTIHLGLYDSEVEAAFAYQCAAPLLHDPDYLHVTPIPAESLPSETRQAEIRQDVVNRVKARLAGRKGSSRSLSRFRGVTGTKRGGPWQATIYRNGRDYHLGLYTVEANAAFAFNVACKLLPGKGRGPNEIPTGEAPDAEARNHIERRVKEVIATGGRLRRDKREPSRQGLPEV